VNPIIVAVIIIVVVALIAAGALSPTFTKNGVSELVEPVVETIGESNDEAFEEYFDESFEESFVESQESSQDCSGTARCITGFVTKIVDGDTIHVDGQSIRFALASAPELSEYGGVESRDFIQTICPVGSDVIVDEDDSQTEGSFGRIIGVITCNGVNINSELLDAGLGYLADQFCDSSEFANDSWAIKHGC
jgi:micrococcal nuclease